MSAWARVDASHAAATLDHMRAIIQRTLARASVSLPPEALVRLREALEESTVPYRVDVVDLADADTEFRERVRREGILWIASASA